MNGLRQNLVVLLLLFAALAGAWLFAQPINGPAVGQVNPQVNTQLYPGGPSGSVRYAQSKAASVAMGSEFRHAYWKSGALPSEIRMGYAALGPMNPTGPLGYIPSGGPSYMPKPSTAPPSAMGSAAYSNASIRYSSPAPSSSASIGPKPISPAPISAAPRNTAIANPGTVRYGR